MSQAHFPFSLPQVTASFAHNGKCQWDIPDVCCCEVVRSALYRDLSDKRLLECVQGKSSEWVSYILDCEPSVGLRSLKVGLLVVVTVLQLAALLWTHWAWTLVKIWKHENNWSWSFGFLCCVVGMCCNGSVEYTASILRVTMTFVFGMCRCTARIGVVVNLVTLSNPPHCWLYRGVHNFLTHMSPLHIPTCWP
jgi:hypothetical protein